MINNETRSLENKKDWKLVNFCEFDKYAIKSYCAIHNVDESLNLGDITKVDETKLEPFNMICGGSPCFVAGTKIMTSNGYKNIENIEVGDYVLTHNNRYMPVTNVGGEKNKNIYLLKAQGFLPTECTDYHPFYCKKNKTLKPEKIRLKDMKKGYYIGCHINKNSVNKYNLSDEDCWILGRYVADGHIRKSKRKERKNSFQYQLVLSVGNSKIDNLKEIINHRHYSCYPHSKSVHRVVFSSMELVDFIIEHNFGRSAEDKTIPNFILDLPVNKLSSFIDGYMAGDGCVIDNIYQATTVSKELAMKLCLAIQKVYRVGCRIYYDKRPDTCVIEGRVVNQKDTYMIRFMKESQKRAWFIENDIVWYPIKEILDTGKIENVYNIEVKEDHTYTANNMITYNCQDFSVAGKQKGSVWTCKECGHEYNPLTVHWSKRDKCPNCNSENIEKTRSSLLVEYLRVIRANKPNFGMYENVKNIVGKQFRDTTFKLFEDELHEYGYNTYWKVLNAKDYGIPQNRERVYLIFIKRELDNGKFVFLEGFNNGIRLKDVLEDEVDEKYYISYEKVAKFLENLKHENICENTILKLNGNNYNQRCVVHTPDDFCRTIIGGGGSGGYHAGNEPKVLINQSENIIKQVDNNSENNPKFIGNINRPDFGTGYAGGVWDIDNISPTLTTMQGGGRQPHIMCGIDKSINDTKQIEYANCLTAREDRGISNRKSEGTAIIEVIGNVNPSGKGMNGNVFSDDGLAPTLTTNKGEGNKILQKPRGFNKGGLHDICPTLSSHSWECNNFVKEQIRIRKLTPKECFRLMGFSDEDYYAAKTGSKIMAREILEKYPHEGKRQMDEAERLSRMSNSQLYKQAGNSIVVDVLYYILIELYKAMPYLFDDLRLSSFFSGIGAFEVALNRLYEGINTGNFTNPQAE